MRVKWDYLRVLPHMKEGDSFFIPCVNTTTEAGRIRRAAKELDTTVSIKEVIEGELKGLRVWRVGSK